MNLNRRDLFKYCAGIPFLRLLCKKPEPCVKRRSGTQYISIGSPANEINSMVTYHGRLYLATTEGLYTTEGDTFSLVCWPESPWDEHSMGDEYG